MNKLYLLAALVVFSCGRVTSADESARLENLFDRYFRETIAINPEDATELGLPREAGYVYDRTAFTDYSDRGIEEQYRLADKFLSELKSINPDKLSPSQQVDRKSLIWLLETMVEGKRYWRHRALLGHLTGVHMQVLGQMADYYSVLSREDAEDYLKRMEKLPARLKQAREQIERQGAEKKLPPNYIIDRTLGSMAEFRASKPSENMMVTSFREKLHKINGMEESEIALYTKQAEDLANGAIYPAYDSLINVVRSARGNAPKDGGAWTMPDGDKYYKWCLKYYTSTDIDPEELHQIGIRETARLQAEAVKLLDSLGIRAEGGYKELMRAYWAKQQGPEFRKYFYSQDESGRRQALKDNQAWLDEAWSKLPDLFEVVPRTRVAVKPVPEHKAGGGTSYYEPASADGSRSAAYYLNMTQVWPKFSMQPTLYHETVPGHHLQIALQQEQGGNRMYRNLFFLSGFGEGWAMYSQALAYELGWLPDPYTRLAEINSQLFRAVRIVMDTGIHLKRWSKKQALTYMDDNLGWSSENEVDRYIVWPGQACAYTLGRLKIMELRSMAKAKMGARFDLRKFHSAVLGHGSVPLDVLEGVINDFCKNS